MSKYIVRYALVGLLGMLVLASGCASTGGGSGQLADKPDWELSMMAYTFRHFTLFEAIERTQSLGFDTMEAFSWQRVSDQHGNAMFDDSCPQEVRRAILTKLEAADIDLEGYYFHNLGEDRAKSTRIFQLCQQMGVGTIVCEPAEEDLDWVEDMAQRHRIHVAIHNHARDPKKPEYKYWNPVYVMRLLEDRSKWIGTCPDTGHWTRSGLDPVESMEIYDGRVVWVHLKDVNTQARDAHDVPWGTGVSHITDVLLELDRQGYAGTFSIEYESNPEDNLDEIRACVNHFRMVAGELDRWDD